MKTSHGSMPPKMNWGPGIGLAVVVIAIAVVVMMVLGMVH